MADQTHALDEFEAAYMKESVYGCLQNGIVNIPSLKDQIEKAIEGKIIISDAEYMHRYRTIIAGMMAGTIIPKS